MSSQLLCLFLLVACAMATMFVSPPSGCLIEGGDMNHFGFTVNEWSSIRWYGNSYAFVQFSGEGLSDVITISDNVNGRVTKYQTGIQCKEYSPSPNIQTGVWISNTTTEFLIQPTGFCKTHGNPPAYYMPLFAWCPFPVA